MEERKMLNIPKEYNGKFPEKGQDSQDKAVSSTIQNKRNREGETAQQVKVPTPSLGS